MGDLWLQAHYFPPYVMHMFTLHIPYFHNVVILCGVGVASYIMNVHSIVHN